MKIHSPLLHALLITALCAGAAQPLHAAAKSAQQKQADEIAAAQRETAEAEKEAQRAKAEVDAADAKLSAESADLETLNQELKKIGPAVASSVASSMNTLNGFFKPARADSPRSLIILKDQGDAKSQSDVEEDLNIMAHLLQKSFRDDSKQAMGITLYSPFESSKTPRSMYLEGYGAIFTLSVNFPFLPAATAKDEAEPKDDKNAEWEEMRRQLQRPPESPAILKWDQSYTSGVAAEEYDAQKVENLK